MKIFETRKFEFFYWTLQMSKIATQRTSGEQIGSQHFPPKLDRRAAHLNSEIRLTIGNIAVFQSKLSAKASDYEQCMKSISFTEPVSIPADLLSDQT